jgi:peroxiredoxin
MEKPAHLNFNDPAPDLSLATATGETIRLASLWASRPLLLVFVRHFGCPQCKELLDFITQNKTRLEGVPLAVALVTQGTPAETLEFCRVHAPGQLCLSDPQRQAYSAYKIERAGLRQTFLSPRVWAANWRASRQKGYQTEWPPAGQDAMQMAAVFVIGADGRIRLPYYYDDIADHPALELLLSGILSTGWNEPFDGPLGARQSLQE